MSFLLYMAGALILIGGLIYAAVLLLVPTPWIVVGGFVALGLAFMGGVSLTRQKDQPN